MHLNLLKLRRKYSKLFLNMVKTAVAHPNFNHWQHTNWDIQCTQVQDSNCLNNITPKNTSKFIQHNALFFICLCKFKFKKKTGCWYSTCSFASCSKNWQKLTLVHSKQTSSLSAKIAPLCSVDPQHTYWYNHAVIYDRNFVKFGLISIIYANIQNAPHNFAAHFPDIIHTKFHAKSDLIRQRKNNLHESWHATTDVWTKAEWLTQSTHQLHWPLITAQLTQSTHQLHWPLITAQLTQSTHQLHWPLITAQLNYYNY